MLCTFRAAEFGFCCFICCGIPAGSCQSHFMRWFKKMTGQGFTAYLNDHRLNLAAELLLYLLRYSRGVMQ